MIRKYLIFCLFLAILLFVSCRRSLTEVEDSALVGTWVELKWEEGIQVLQKSAKLDNNKYGFIIAANGQFTEHANSGGCGTPPIVYANYDGNWNYISPDSIHIDVAFWGGNTAFDFKIISMDGYKLEIKRIY